MLEEIVAQGVWWLPADPENLVAGTLTYKSGSDPELSLIGRLGDWEEFTFYAPSIILGTGSDGAAYTLYLAHHAGSSFGSGPSTQKFHAQYLFVGAHFQNSDELVFDHFDVHFSHLMDWARISGIRTVLESTDALPLSRFELEFNWPAEIRIEMPGFSITLKTQFTSGGDRIETHTVTERLYFHIRTADKQQVSELHSSIIYHLQNFLTFVIESPVYPTRIETIARDNRDRPCQVKVYYKETRAGETTESILPHRMLVAYGIIAPIFPDVLKRWFERAAVLKPSMDLYFSNIYSPFTYAETRFLNLAQAVESYHRRSFGGTYVSEAKFKELQQRFEAAIGETFLGEHLGKEKDPDAANAFAGKVQFINELSLPGRIKNLVSLLGDDVSSIIPKTNRFVRKVADTRNFFTHYSSDLERRTAQGIELYVLTEQVKFLLELCFLAELGIPADLRTQIVAQNQRYLFFRTHYEQYLDWNS